MVDGRNYKIIFFGLFIAISLIYVLDFFISKTEQQLYEKLEKSAIDDMHNIALNIESHFIDDNTTNREANQSLFQYFKENPEVRQHLEDEIGILITSKIKYLYLIYKDDKDRFRFLLDGSFEDKANFNQKLDVANDEYKMIYTTKKEYAISQNDLHELSVTYLYPFIKDDRVDAILVFDFSSSFESEMREVIAPLKGMFILAYIMLGLFLIVTIVQTYLFLRTRERSYTDELTKTFNRQYLRYFLDSNNIKEYQVLMIDFDFFKKINDNYGHDVGDEVLIYGTQLIKENIRSSDQVVRYGGEEFLVLIKNTNNNDAQLIAENVRASIEKAHYKKDNIDINITVSIGVNPIPGHARNTSEAIKIADTMLYQAKLKGRNRVVIYSNEEKLDIEHKHSLRDTIYQVKSALNNDRVMCHFQKIVDTSNKIYKYEALVRYINEKGDIIYPNHFLYDIVHTKTYLDVSKRVIDICTDTISQKKVHISINLNVKDLLNTQLMNYLIEGLEELGEDSSYFSIEILENEDIENLEELQQIIEKIHQYNVKFAIDDFGSGYANFSYLVALNIDYIKIDGSLVEGIVSSKKSKSIVHSIIKMSKDMNIKTIVEFVSSKEVYEEVLKLDVDYMQGYYISKPEARI